MPVYERISAVVSLSLIGLALYFVLEFPRQVAAITLLDSPMALVAPRQWLMAFLVAGLAMAGADGVIRTHAGLPDRRAAYLATFWMLPGLLVIVATQTLGLAANPVVWAASLGGIGLLLWLTILAEYRQVSTAATTAYGWPRLWRQLVGFGVALPLFMVIYYTRSRSALSATGIMLVAGMVALALLRHQPRQLAKTWLFAAVIGLSLGQITWALNYWRVGALQAGLLLLLILYVLIGVAQQQLLNSLSRRVLAEFGLVVVIALAVILNL
jgi:hypothetical protein